MLSKGGDRVEAARSRVAENGQRFGEARQLVEGSAHLAGNFRCLAGSSKQLLALLEMPVPQRLDASQRTDQMAFRRLFTDCEKRICRSAKRRNDDCGLSCQTPFDDRGRALDRLRVAHRCAAKL